MQFAASPSLAVKNGPSPKGWSQKWAHELSTTANYSEISTSNARPSLPWAQGAAGSNPAAPRPSHSKPATGVSELAARTVAATVRDSQRCQRPAVVSTESNGRTAALRTLVNGVRRFRRHIVVRVLVLVRHDDIVRLDETNRADRLRSAGQKHVAREIVRTLGLEPLVPQRQLVSPGRYVADRKLAGRIGDREVRPVDHHDNGAHFRVDVAEDVADAGPRAPCTRCNHHRSDGPAPLNPARDPAPSMNTSSAPATRSVAARRPHQRAAFPDAGVTTMSKGCQNAVERSLTRRRTAV